MNVWDSRAEAYRSSPTHASGADLDQVVAWCEPGPGVSALDVATGGGHVARRLRELGCNVVTCDASAGMEPDVVCPAEALPFPARSFDVVVCRLAVHHFDRPAAAVSEMARVSRRLVVVEDTLFTDRRIEEAEVLRDASHVATRTRVALLEMFAGAGLRVVEDALFPKTHPMDAWLSAAGCSGVAAEGVRRLLAHVSAADGTIWTDHKIVLKGEVPAGE